MLNTGGQFAGYRIVRQLGEGGMGAVYLAAHPTLPRNDALKVLSRELSRDPDFRTRFLREADVAASLDHPNIVSVYDRGQTEDGQLWIAMQFVDGTDADAAQRAGTMSPRRAVHIVAEVAKALDYAHANNVVHRDIKPANFLLSGPIGPDERVLLGDFGIARALGDIGLTVTGAVMATVAYAAPEVLAGQPFDGRSDIYSLGCTLYRLLTGRAPYPGDNGMAAVMMAHLQQPPPRVTDAVPGLPPALDDVIAVAMAKDPGARFPTATAMSRAAVEALHNPYARRLAPASVTPAPAPGTPAPAAARPRRRGLVAAAVGAVVLVVAGTVAAVAWPRGDTEQAAESTVGPDGQLTRQTTAPTAAGPPATDVPVSELRSILVAANAVTATRDDNGSDPLVLESDTNGPLTTSDTLSAPECLAAWAPAQQQVYQTSQMSGMAAQTMRRMNRREWQGSVTQAVVAFPADIQQNAGFFRVQIQKDWGPCEGREIVVTPPGDAPQTWTFGQLVNIGGVQTLTATLRGGGGSCQRGMVVRGNVLIDVRECRAEGNNNASGLVQSIADEVPQQ